MIEFFTDVISGWVYYLYIGIDLLFIFALIGVIAEKKNSFIDKQKLNIEINEEETIVQQPTTNPIPNVSSASPPIITTPVQVQKTNDASQVQSVTQNQPTEVINASTNIIK